MKKFVGISAAAVVLAPSPAFADTPLHAYEYINIKAPPAKVWKMIEGFDGMQAWHPDVVEARIVEGAPGEVGTIREVQYKDGTTVRQELPGTITMQCVSTTRWSVNHHGAWTITGP